MDNIPLNGIFYFVDNSKITIFASDEAETFDSMDVSDSQHGYVDRFCIAPPPPSAYPLFAFGYRSLWM
jgi:hypothetical protein